MTATTPKPRRRLLFAAIVTLAFLAALELAARGVELLRPPQAVDFGAGFDPASRVFVPTAANPGLVETAPAKLASFRAQVFAARKPAGTLRVVALGGSCVSHLDDELRNLERNLYDAFAPRFTRVEVINAGGLSYGSGRLVTVTAEMLGYDPDLVLYYEAHNEFEEAEQRQRAALGTAETHRVLSHSAVFRLVRDAAAAAREPAPPPPRPPGPVRPDTPDFTRGLNTRYTREEVDARMRAMRENLLHIVGACRARNVPIVLSTVPSNLLNPVFGPHAAADYAPARALFARGAWDEGAALGRKVLAESLGRHQSSDVENGIIRRIAVEEQVPLVDIEGAIQAAEPHRVPGETLFIDQCHFTAAGCGLVRSILELAAVDVLRARLGGR